MLFIQRLGSCVTETVDFTNTGSCPVHVSWTPEEDDDGSVSVEPGEFDVADRTTVEVRVRPLRAGRLRCAVTFRARNRDGNVRETVVYVRGTVETTPEVHIRPTAMAPVPDAVCADVPQSYVVDFHVKSAHPFHVQRHLYEFDGALGTLRLRAGDVKTFGPYGSGSDAAAAANNNNNNPVTVALHFPTPVVTEVSGKHEQGGDGKRGGGAERFFFFFNK